MSTEKPPGLKTLTADISKTIHEVLNGKEPTTVGYILVVMPVGQVPPVQMELGYNLTEDSMLTCLRELIGRLEGRTVDVPGEA